MVTCHDRHDKYDTLNTSNAATVHVPIAETLHPPAEPSVPQHKQYSLAEAHEHHAAVLADGIIHNCSSCLECKSQKQLKTISMNKLCLLPVNWLNRMVPSTACLENPDINAMLDRPFIHHMCQQAGHHAELVPQPPPLSSYRRLLEGPDVCITASLH